MGSRITLELPVVFFVVILSLTRSKFYFVLVFLKIGKYYIARVYQTNVDLYSYHR